MPTKHLFLLPGWGMPCTLWDPFISALPASICASPLSLPGFGAPLTTTAQNPREDLCLAADLLAARIPSGALLCGWSLGGILASYIAQRHPKKCAALLTIATNESFVQHASYQQAMTAEVFTAFYERVRKRPAASLSGFLHLAAQGIGSKSLLREIRSKVIFQQDWQYLRGLNWLKTANLAPIWAHLCQPHQHLFATKDALIPKSAALRLAGTHRVSLLPGSHFFLYETPQALALWVTKHWEPLL